MFPVLPKPIDGWQYQLVKNNSLPTRRGWNVSRRQTFSCLPSYQLNLRNQGRFPLKLCWLCEMCRSPGNFGRIVKIWNYIGVRERFQKWVDYWGRRIASWQWKGDEVFGFRYSYRDGSSELLREGVSINDFILKLPKYNEQSFIFLTKTVRDIIVRVSKSDKFN